MRDVKYVVIKEAFEMETIILFPAHMSHKAYKNNGFDVLSAGFVGRSNQTKSGFYCYGYSDSLNLKCRDTDQRLLDLMMRDD